ncbi:T9SS type A sorting domain-containing protein [Xanthomarina spongicola]|uniref:Putative secreted protein (Por secretion system target) n=1 Tax=Xanthomarina spongicola TaxID=570520 RepID=A0A316DSR9_9FLAO|nr:T9SS type A sorting domain-containing protein [Xanthomarina spongicola]PWK21035.1 putative secreted protein (Por secretion system target) [Xanthomarina spongicola]
MKKITLLFILLLAFTTQAQTVVWSDDFNDEDISDWTLTDSDGDTNNWGDQFVINDSGGSPVTPVSLISRSWLGSPLTPDNWAVSPSIDLSEASGLITLEYITQVAAASWDEEKYSIYVGTTNDISVLVNSAVTLTETLGDAGNTGTPTPHLFDISAMAGEPVVYVAFRHWDCVDQDFLSVDDVTVSAETLSIEEFTEPNVYKIGCNNQYISIYNVNDEVNYKLISLTGQQLLEGKTSNKTHTIDATSLASGVYIIEISNPLTNAVFRKKIAF